MTMKETAAAVTGLVIARFRAMCATRSSPAVSASPSWAGGKIVAFCFFGLFLVQSAAGLTAPKDAVGAAPQTPPPVSSDPQATSATYGDWVHICRRHAASGERLCEIAQSIQVQGHPGPIAQLAVSAPEGTPDLRLTAVLPANILLTESPRVAIDEKDPEAVALTWQRCLPGGCFADAALKEAVLAKWRALTERGRVEFRDGAGRALVVPFSYRGFAQALEALVKK